MKIGYDVVIKVLKCFINEENFSDSISDEQGLIQVAQKHQILPIIYYVLKKSGYTISDSRTSYAFQISYHVKRKKAEEAFSNALSGIPHIYYKGSVVAEQYPVPQLRTMGDVDVLIHQDDRKRVHELLVQNGFVFTRRDEEDNGVWHYYKGNTEFEVHTFVLHPDELNNSHKEFFEDAWRYVSEDGQFDWNYHFLILIAHIREHLIKSGIGIRPFIDVAIVSQKISLDWQWIRSKANEIGLANFLVTVVSLNKIWFGIKSPMAVELDESFGNESLEYIMRNGVFGFDNPDNDNVELSRTVVLDKKSMKSAKISNLIKQAFPPYNAMARLPYCSYIEVYKWLLPFAWVHRFFYGIVDKNHRKSFVSRTLVIDHGAEKKIKMLQQWGV